MYVWALIFDVGSRSGLSMLSVVVVVVYLDDTCRDISSHGSLGLDTGLRIALVDTTYIHVYI